MPDPATLGGFDAQNEVSSLIDPGELSGATTRAPVVLAASRAKSIGSGLAEPDADASSMASCRTPITACMGGTSENASTNHADLKWTCQTYKRQDEENVSFKKKYTNWSELSQMESIRYHFLTVGQNGPLLFCWLLDIAWRRKLHWL